jgi:lipoprotein NlpD
MQYFRKALQFLWLPLCLFINACGPNIHAPVITPGENQRTERTAKSPSQDTNQPTRKNIIPPAYTVKRGDTLYSIAWNYGYDYRDVAAWNRIHPPYTIYPGQRISLLPATTRPPNNPPALVPGPIESNRKNTQPQVKIAAKKEDQATDNHESARKLPVAAGSVKWAWPTLGKIIKTDTPISKNGIDISGTLRQEITAAANGDVVYSGSGLLGYGRLIIIKHNDTYLSAYAHNNELLVKEGDRVAVGHNIARMGQTSNGRTILHFEIRKNGQPVDPMKYLPKL